MVVDYTRLVAQRNFLDLHSPFRGTLTPMTGGADDELDLSRPFTRTQAIAAGILHRAVYVSAAVADSPRQRTEAALHPEVTVQKVWALLRTQGLAGVPARPADDWRPQACSCTRDSANNPLSPAPDRRTVDGRGKGGGPKDEFFEDA